MLLRTCGAGSSSARKAKTSGLTESDVGLLAARFDTGGFVHYPDFLAYFRAEAQRGTTDSARISPFTLTAEWDRLKSCTLQRSPCPHSRRDS